VTRRLTRRKIWQINKICSEQQDIAIKLSEINVKSKEQFVKDHEKNGFLVPEKTRFPSIVQIYDRFSAYNSANKDVEQTTPK